MPASNEPSIGLFYDWDLGESGIKAQLDANTLSIGNHAIQGVLSASTTTPPGSPSDGDKYLVPTGATGDWLAAVDNVVRWVGTVWEAYSPRVGQVVTALDTGQMYIYNGSAWVTRISLLGAYVDDTAAGTGGVAIGEEYVNSTTGAVTRRLT